jgi:hypothetical protein
LLFVVYYTPATATEDDYLDDTLVYQTLEQGELELESWLDFVRSNEENNFYRNTFALEHGITDYLQVEGFASFSNAEDKYGLESWQLEVRYHFDNWNIHGISPAFSLEYEDDRLEHSQILVPRLVLNRDFDELNITVDLLGEIEIRGSEGNALGYALGLRYGEDQRRFRPGVEVKQTSGSEIRGAIIPQVSIRLTNGTQLKLGYSQGFTHKDTNFFRLVFEAEF